MFFALALLVTTDVPDQLNCNAYRAGMRELRAGKKASAARRYRTAYRHYSRGLDAIADAYDASMDRIRIREHVLIHDESGLTLGLAVAENRRGYYQAASTHAQTILVEHLASIRKENNCHR